MELPYSAITEDTAAKVGTSGTSQAYWLETENENTQHMLWVKGVRGMLYASRGDMRVEFTASGVVLTNTGKETWPAGDKYALKLDRTSRIPSMDGRYANPETLPLPVASTAHDATGGLVAMDDFFGRSRGSAPSKGAVEPL